MGWTHHLDSTLKFVVNEVTTANESETTKILAKCFRGNPAFSGILWVVWEIKKKDYRRVVIACNILQYWNHKDGKGWAVKEIDETFGPVAVNCPLKYLKLASGPDSYESHKYSKEWRERVKAYHLKKKGKV